MLIMDLEEFDELGQRVTGSVSADGEIVKVHVGNTAKEMSNRNIDSSFAATYFPDTYITDPHTSTNVQCPPSVSVLGAFALNDAVAHPWFAPAGFTRGALATSIETHVKLSKGNMDTLYDQDINPITSFPDSQGVVVFGQKTLLAAQNSLDRVNVRRLLIEIRRQVKAIGNTILFEPNRAEVLARFSGRVQPILARIQAQQGLDRFRVQIDTSTTTQADVENNTIRGKVFLQPTRSVEFIALDFVVTNAGSGI
jgi:phage tail sheath protein FI